MATIALVLDHEEGHLIPTFPLARRLGERGHRVIYMTLADAGDFVRENGFDFVPILEDVFPPGAAKTLREGSESLKAAAGLGKAAVEADAAAGKLALYEQYLAALVQSRPLAATVEREKPDLFITLSMFSLTALVLRFRFDLPVILLTSYLREEPKAAFAQEVEMVLMRMRRGAAAFFELMLAARPQARRLSDVSVEVLQLRELVLCPEAFEIPQPGKRPEPEVYYIEAPVETERLSEKGQSFPWEKLDPGKKLLLCSMGSQSYIADPGVLTRFYRAVAEMAAGLPGWQLVLSSGGMVEEAELTELPADAVVARWVPQLALLKRTAVMITHGGLGAVREAIAHGVPMVVYAIGRDQPSNAARVVHHGMGLSGALGEATTEGIRDQVLRVDAEPSFRAAVARMRERFAELERSEIGMRLIEELAAGAPRRQAVAV